MNTFTDEQLSKMNYEQSRTLSHRFKYPESARYLHGVAQAESIRYERAGNVCMAHAKRLQARYWARRAFGPFDQPMRYVDWVKIGNEQAQLAWRHA